MVGVLRPLTLANTHKGKARGDTQHKHAHTRTQFLSRISLSLSLSVTHMSHLSHTCLHYCSQEDPSVSLSACLY